MLFHTGLVQIKRRYLPRYPVTILGYHQVHTPVFLRDTMGWSMTPDLFRAQVEYAARFHTVVSLRDLEEIVFNSRAIPKNALVLTFDDGYRDVHDVALPVLSRLGVPATVFITTGAVDRQESIWTNKIYYYFHVTRKTGFLLELSDGTKIEARWETPDQKRADIMRVNRALKMLPDSDRMQAVRTLADALDVSWDDDPVKLLPMLTWDTIRSLRDSSVFTLGAHTVNHPILSRCETAKQAYELEESRRRIEEETGAACRYLAYPNGQKPDVTGLTQTLAREAGYALAFMYCPGTPGEKIDPMAVPRHPVMTPDLAEFAWRIS